MGPRMIFAVENSLGNFQNATRKDTQGLAELPFYYHLPVQDDGERDKQGQKCNNDKVFHSFRLKNVVITESVHGSIIKN
jgi:hypothetical protein